MDKNTIIHLFHIIFVSSLFLYVGINRDKTNLTILKSLLYLGILVILYHSYRAYTKTNGKWINYLHMFLIGPLLVIIGYNNINTSRAYFELLLMLGMTSITYHTYYLF